MSVCRTKGSITARPVSYPAGNELSQQSRYVAVEKPATSPIKPRSTSYTHPLLDLEQSSHIQTSSLTLCTQSP
ncbi:hypothetical protein PAMP_002147 [Pampus punctatissimus]